MEIGDGESVEETESKQLLHTTLSASLNYSSKPQ